MVVEGSIRRFGLRNWKWETRFWAWGAAQLDESVVSHAWVVHMVGTHH